MKKSEQAVPSRLHAYHFLLGNPIQRQQIYQIKKNDQFGVSINLFLMSFL